MAYDEELADRVRELIASLTAFEERKMFGGLVFMVNTHMACGIVKDDLLVRVGKDGHAAALARGAHEMELTGRPMRGVVIVPAAQLVDESALGGWVALGLELARSEPPKASKKT